MTEPREQEFHGTYTQYQDFMGSLIWHDIRRELEAWLENARSELEVESLTERIYRLQGVCESLKRVINLPDQILETLAIMEPNRRRRRADG